MKENLIKKVSEEDLKGIQTIDSFSPYPWPMGIWMEEYKDPTSYCYVRKSEEENQIVGFICFRIVGEESELLNLGVHPKYRSRGIGKELMNFYINFCKERGVRSFFLEVSVENMSALRLYQGLQYQIMGTRRKFYSGKVDAWVMRRSF
ncbi:MAG: ribosomal protein S18-alanine N-acetyltransferase [Thermodesulfobacteriota bacterium]